MVPANFSPVTQIPTRLTDSSYFDQDVVSAMSADLRNLKIHKGVLMGCRRFPVDGAGEMPVVNESLTSGARGFALDTAT
jgi:hypothetical protein